MTSLNKEQLIEMLAKGYKQQRELYQEMVEIATTQLQLCQEVNFNQDEELSRLTGLISKRAELISRLDKHNEVLDKVKRQLAELLGLKEVRLSVLQTALGTASFAQTQALNQALAEVGGLLKQINELDGKSQGLMDQKLKGLKFEIDKIQVEKKAQQQYRNIYNQQPDPMFLDKKK